MIILLYMFSRIHQWCYLILDFSLLFPPLWRSQSIGQQNGIEIYNNLLEVSWWEGNMCCYQRTLDEQSGLGELRKLSVKRGPLGWVLVEKFSGKERRKGLEDSINGMEEWRSMIYVWNYKQFRVTWGEGVRWNMREGCEMKCGRRVTGKMWNGEKKVNFIKDSRKLLKECKKGHVVAKFASPSSSSSSW